MTDISAIGGNSVGQIAGRIDPVVRSGRRADARVEDTTAAATGTQRGEDRVEVSRVAQYLRRLSDLPAIREDLVARVREEIETGVYDSSERLDGALDELIAEQSSEG